MASDDELCTSLAASISSLARRTLKLTADHPTLDQQPVSDAKLPGTSSGPKTALEQELALLASRIQVLEARASGLPNGRSLPATPSDEMDPPSDSILTVGTGVARPGLYKRSTSSPKSAFSSRIDSILSNPQSNIRSRQPLQLSNDVMTELRDLADEQESKIQEQNETIRHITAQLQHQKEHTESALGTLSDGASDIGALKRELMKHQQANMAFQTSLREIGNIVTAVANGDLSQKVSIHEKEMDPEITTFKHTINTMVDQLQSFSVQVTQLARETGEKGRLGGQAVVPGVSGIWAELQANVNLMSKQLTEQVRDIAKVTSAVANGDLTQKVSAPCQGEVLELKNTINGMIDFLRKFASEVTNLALEVGTEGRLGGQAAIYGVEGTWKDLTGSVNKLAKQLTEQVREIAEVTTAVARGDLSRKVEADVKGEILQLKVTINDMVDRLRIFAFEVSKVAREVGTEGILGGQAKVDNVEGKWNDLTLNVNTMASNLTAQVRAFADITESAISGDFSRQINIAASGEMDDLKNRINIMVTGLRESFERINAAREVAEAANKTKTEFLANMSHEIRTPMNGIIGLTQLTLDSELQSMQRDMLNNVHSLANNLLTIIDDILDISKIEANKMELERIPFSLRRTVFDALKGFAVRANNQALNLQYEVDNYVPDYVVGDQHRLRQIIVNLVNNALKFTERGEVKVAISLYQRDRPSVNAESHMLKFSVTDTGIGIAQDKLDLIFDTFQQADGSTTRKFGGTGLGLSISKKLVGLMDGNLWVESNFGQGSTFSFTCRLGAADSNPSLVKQQLRTYKSHNVLLIDQGNSDCISEIVYAMGQLDIEPVVIRKPATFTSTELPHINAQAYDCVVVDNHDIARGLRNLENYKYIPIMLVAKMLSISFRTALEDGIISYITTPCLPIDMGNAILPALESRSAPAVSDKMSSLKILLAEDNTTNQKVAVKFLEKSNHKVTVANNGLEAVEFVKQERFDAILMDVQMPVMGGYQATAEIRAYEKRFHLRRTPIIALTAHAMIGDREKCTRASMDVRNIVFLEKSVTNDV